MDFIIVPIQPEYRKEDVYLQLAELAISLGMKPNEYVAGTEDEKYSLIAEMLSAIIRKELQVVRLVLSEGEECPTCDGTGICA